MGGRTSQDVLSVIERHMCRISPRIPQINHGRACIYRGFPRVLWQYWTYGISIL